MTFREAYFARTGRILNISVIPADRRISYVTFRGEDGL